jgi:hypothetical protein
MARASAAAAREEAAAARMATSDRAAQLRGAEQAICELARQARLHEASFEAAEKCLREGEGRVAALARRLAFAEDRLKVQ